jgi:hypothetical protein
MTDQDADRKQGIEELLAERKKFEAWLAQLEAKRSSAAMHVFDRVFADYTKRLEDVRGRLLGEADALKSLVGDLETRLAKEQEKVTKKTDERAEAELRAMVGEFSEKEWGTTKSKLDSSIADLRAKFDGTERELAELKELLSSVTGAPAPARASVMIAADASVTAALDEAAEAEAETPEAESADDASEAVKPDAAPAESSPPEPEPEPVAEPIAAPIVAEAPPAVEAKPAKESKAPEVKKAAEPAPRKSTPFDELAFLRSVAGTPSRPSGNAAIPAPPAIPVMPEPPLIAEPEPEPAAVAEPEPKPVVEAPSGPKARGSSKVAEQEDASPLGAPTPRTSQAIRSLKCQECGTLNFPTEWYCERCGGELAAF